MSRLSRFVLVLACVGAWAAADGSRASADFGIVEFSGGALDGEGSSYTQAAGHPSILTTTFKTPAAGFLDPDGQVKDVAVDLPPGFVTNPSITPVRCTLQELSERRCPISSQVGTATLYMPFAPGVNGPSFFGVLPVFNMVPPHGAPAKLAFATTGATPTYISLLPELRSDDDYGITVLSPDTSQGAPITGVTVSLWGVPADPSHDAERGYGCSNPGSECSNPAGYTPAAFFTNPGNCAAGAQPTVLSINSWQDPDVWHTASFDHDLNGTPTAVTACEAVALDLGIDAEETTDQADTPSGLDFEIESSSEGLLNPGGIAEAHLKRAVVRLPVGTTLNPSAAEGLGACSRIEFARESASSAAGDGCPNSSRLGSVAIETPLLDEPVEGSLYLAQQDDPGTLTPGAENPFDSLLAIYVVARNSERGIVIKLPGRVDPDPQTGQIVTRFDDLPQLPFSRFHLRFREGARAALVSPASCGTYTTEAEFAPWSAADPDNPTADEIVDATSDFEITRGVGGGPCPSGGVPPFKPGLVAGTRNNAAGSYSPFDLRLFRQDGEQEFTHFSIKLPPGVTGKLAGIPYCPDAAIDAMESRTGAAELASPACPEASYVGRTLVGAGVGAVQTYVPGKVYLAGPYNGSALSIVAVTPAKVGPFDLGTIAIREALKIDRRTAEVFIDATGSDPLPHIIDGVTTHLRDIRVYVDRPEFVLNPTSCDPTSTASTVLGSGLDFASPADDTPVTVTTRFQAANCATLPFKPKLKLSVSGSTKRAGNPAFKAVLTMKPGEANVARAQVTLPGSEFLDNAHIRTICTRVQYAAEQCPAGSIYGKARAFTPILDQPLEGPVYLRSNPEHELPDLVAKLQNGQIVIDLVGHVDSFGKGRIRNTFEAVPDAPVSRFVLEMAGGKKGLLENSQNLCRGKRRALVAFDGQNGKIHDFRAQVRPTSCGKKKRKR